MASLDTDLTFTDIFTYEERVQLWKIDDFQFYWYAWPTHLGYRPIVDDIIACTDERIASGEKGANLHFVFYRSKKSDTILFKVLLNGEEARLPLIETSTWPYYDWVEFKRVFER